MNSKVLFKEPRFGQACRSYSHVSINDVKSAFPPSSSDVGALKKRSLETEAKYNDRYHCTSPQPQENAFYRGFRRRE